jgi:adenosylcobinamide kinase/adenosylcobinamide-phosphate guanylyltransferase
MTTRTLIIGGARSGKSAHAERLASASGKKVVYIATAQAGDEEMQQRIEHHRQRRHGNWQTVEEMIALADAIERHAAADTLVLVDCLTVWLSNLLFSEQREFPEIGAIDAPACFTEQRARLLQALAHAAGDVLLVTNEVGQGVVPQGAVSRWFVDEAGRLNQDVAAICDRAVLIVAGLPLALKG